MTGIGKESSCPEMLPCSPLFHSYILSIYFLKKHSLKLGPTFIELFILLHLFIHVLIIPWQDITVV